MHAAGYSLPPRGMDPRIVLGSSLKLWWATDDYESKMTDDGGGLISSWTDRIAGLAITAATTARATWGAQTFHGKRGMTFDGSANCYVTTTLTAFPTGAADAGMLIVFDGVTQAAQGIMAIFGGTATDRCRLDKPSVQNANVSDGSTNLGDSLQGRCVGPTVLAGYWSGTTMSGFCNGRPFSPRSATIATKATGTTRFRLGAANGTSANTFAQMTLRHCLVFGTATEQQIRTCMDWLAWESGIRHVLSRFQ